MKLEQQLCFESYKAASNFSKMYARLLEPFGLTFPQYLVLLVLWENDGISMKEIGDRLGLGTGTLNPILNRLIAQGRIVKEQSPQDRRASIISLAGKAVDEQEPVKRAVLEQLEQCHSPDIDATGLMKNLKHLNALFEEMGL